MMADCYFPFSPDGYLLFLVVLLTVGILIGFGAERVVWPNGPRKPPGRRLY